MPPFLETLGTSFASSIPSLLGTIGQIVYNDKAQKKQNKENRKLVQLKFAQDKEMWNLQNEYNAPAAQMQRLSDAGLNPNLVYGSGSVVGNTTSNAPQVELPNYETYKHTGKHGLENAFQASVAYQQAESTIKLQDSQRQVNEAEARNKDAYTKNIQLDSAYKELNNAEKQLDLAIKQQAASDIIEKYKKDVEEAQARIDHLLKLDTQIENQIDFVNIQKQTEKLKQDDITASIALKYSNIVRNDYLNRLSDAQRREVNYKVDHYLPALTALSEEQKEKVVADIICAYASQDLKVLNYLGEVYGYTGDQIGRVCHYIQQDLDDLGVLVGELHVKISKDLSNYYNK